MPILHPSMAWTLPIPSLQGWKVKGKDEQQGAAGDSEIRTKKAKRFLLHEPWGGPGRAQGVHRRVSREEELGLVALLSCGGRSEGR